MTSVSFDMQHQGGHVGELTCEWCTPPSVCESIRREKKGTSVGRWGEVELTFDCKQPAWRRQLVTGGGKSFGVSFCHCLSVCLCRPLSLIIILPLSLCGRQQQLVARCLNPKKTIKVPLSKALNPELLKRSWVTAAEQGNTCFAKANQNDDKKQNKSVVFVTLCPLSVSPSAVSLPLPLAIPLNISHPV